MPLKFVRNDITAMDVDAIVNAANRSLLGGGGVDGAIHKAAGPRLLEECRKLGGCEVGEAKLTRGYDLPAHYVIHTVGPIWRGGEDGEEALLRACYRNSLSLAAKKRCKSVAFPLISSGAYGYPKQEAVRVAAEEIRAFLLAEKSGEMVVYLVFFGGEETEIGKTLYPDMESYIDDYYASLHRSSNRRAREWEAMYGAGRAPYEFSSVDGFPAEAMAQPKSMAQPKATVAKRAASSVDDALKNLDEGFAVTLLKRIDASGMTDPECYTKANIDRKLFSKIKNKKGYRPSKQTVLAFCIALELPLSDTEDLLMRAGYALSPADKGDVIVRFFIEKKQFDIDKINICLLDHDQRLLGA